MGGALETLTRRRTACEKAVDLVERRPKKSAPPAPPAVQSKSTPPAKPIAKSHALKPIAIGVTFTSEPYALNFQDLPNQFVLISGASGTGKTTLLKRVASELHRQGVPILALDFHGDLFLPGARPYRLDEKLGIEPLTVAGSGSIESVYEVLSANLAGLGHVQREQLRELLQSLGQRELRARTLLEAAQQLAHNPALSTAQRTAAAGLLAALRTLFAAPVFLAADHLSANQMLAGGRLQLSGLTRPAQRLAAQAILSQIFDSLRTLGPVGKSGALRLAVAIDEANLLQGSPIVETLIRESRKFGLCLLCASQQIRDHSPVLLSNAAVLAVFRPGSEIEMREIERATGLSRVDLRQLAPRGQCLIRTPTGAEVVTVTPPEEPKK